jgi:hypothetical protein
LSTAAAAAAAAEIGNYTVAEQRQQNTVAGQYELHYNSQH